MGANTLSYERVESRKTSEKSVHELNVKALTGFKQIRRNDCVRWRKNRRTKAGSQEQVERIWGVPGGLFW